MRSSIDFVVATARSLPNAHGGYSRSVDPADLDPDPHLQFERWFAEAAAAGVTAPEQMALATADADGRPSVRMVLLKGHDERGFVFYTNRTSRKARELEANPWAAATLYWELQSRQVRIEGAVERVGDEESLAYFHTRARASQVSAWASPQSQACRRQGGAGAAGRRGRAALRRGGPAAAAAVLGRLPHRRGGDRVLAGPAEPPARPRALRAATAARWNRERLGP